MSNQPVRPDEDASTDTVASLIVGAMQAGPDGPDERTSLLSAIGDLARSEGWDAGLDDDWDPELEDAIDRGVTVTFAPTAPRGTGA